MASNRSHKSFHPSNCSFPALRIKTQQFCTVLTFMAFKDFFRVGSHRSERIPMDCDGPKVSNWPFKWNWNKCSCLSLENFSWASDMKTKPSFYHPTPGVQASPSNFCSWVSLSNSTACRVGEFTFEIPTIPDKLHGEAQNFKAFLPFFSLNQLTL